MSLSTKSCWTLFVNFNNVAESYKEQFFTNGPSATNNNCVFRDKYFLRLFKIWIKSLEISSYKRVVNKKWYLYFVCLKIPEILLICKISAVYYVFFFFKLSVVQIVLKIKNRGGIKIISIEGSYKKPEGQNNT
jgi:hypothetical protein